MSKKICKIVSKFEVPACCNLFIYPQLAFNASQIWRDKSQIGSSVPPSAVAISSKHSASASVRVFSYVIFDCLQLSVLCCACYSRVIHESHLLWPSPDRLRLQLLSVQSVARWVGSSIVCAALQAAHSYIYTETHTHTHPQQDSN